MQYVQKSAVIFITNVLKKNYKKIHISDIISRVSAKNDTIIFDPTTAGSSVGSDRNYLIWFVRLDGRYYS